MHSTRCKLITNDFLTKRYCNITSISIAMNPQRIMILFNRHSLLKLDHDTRYKFLLKATVLHEISSIFLKPVHTSITRFVLSGTREN